MPQKKSILFVINPKAGVDRVKAINKAISATLDQSKFDVELVYTEYAKHGTELARNAAEKGVDIVVAVGGDGSLNDIVSGIYGSKTILGIIPKGSGNGLARTLGIPLKIEEAIAVINQMKLHALDVGKANDHLFISNAGVGFDAVVTKKFEGNEKRGLLTYVKIITQKIWTYKARHWNITIDGQSLREKAFMITVANGKQLGYNFHVAPQAVMDDGLLDLVLIRNFPRIFGGIIALQAFSGILDKSPFVKTFRGKSIQLHSANNTLMQADGDCHTCPETLEMTVMPQPLQVIIP